MHLDYLGPVFCFSPPQIPHGVHPWLQWLRALFTQHPSFTDTAGNILCPTEGRTCGNRGRLRTTPLGHVSHHGVTQTYPQLCDFLLTSQDRTLTFGVLPTPFCNREEPNQNTGWICFFYFNLCFLLLLFTKRILCIHNGQPLGTLPLCLNVKPKCLCSGKHLDPVHLWMAAGKKKLTHPLPEAGYSRGHLRNLWPFYFTCSSPPPPRTIKETGIQTLTRWLF